MPVSKHWKENPDKYKDYLLQRNFGLSLAEYREILETQNNACAICGKKNGSDLHSGTRTKQLSVDHDHKNGIVRGLLCNDCNRAIGQLQDDPRLLRKAAEYLEKHQQIHAKLSGLADDFLKEISSE